MAAFMAIEYSEKKKRYSKILRREREETDEIGSETNGESTTKELLNLEYVKLLQEV